MLSEDIPTSLSQIKCESMTEYNSTSFMEEASDVMEAACLGQPHYDAVVALMLPPWKASGLSYNRECSVNCRLLCLFVWCGLVSYVWSVLCNLPACLPRSTQHV